MDLPEDLSAALQDRVQAAGTRHVMQSARNLSDRYRDGRQEGTSFLLSETDALAYAAYRLPATFAAVATVFAEARRQLPGWLPSSLLDVGAGPGTASWAAVTTWPELQAVTLVERDPNMIALGKDLMNRAQASALRRASWIRADVTPAWEAEPADLSVASYLIGELNPAVHLALVERLWQLTGTACVIVEPGTPTGFAVVRQAAHRLAESGAHIIAPVPRAWTCLEHEHDWLHFATRVPRTRFLRAMKEGNLAYEDEKFSYVIACRQPGNPIAARVIRHPQIRSGHIRLVLCTSGGVRHITVSRRDRDAFKLAKRLAWGSAISPAEGDLLDLPA